MDKIILILILTNFITIGYGAEYFVSPDGNDKNPGTLKKPFRTIQKAVKSVKSGDICFIRGGRYEESIKIDNLNLSGTAVNVGNPHIIFFTEDLDKY